MAPKLHVVTVSTRPGRIGPAIAQWFTDFARTHGKFEVEPIDLADFELPLYDEAHHPMRRQYEKEHTKKWSASVKSADAFVFVTPEYNYSPPPSFTNALDYLFWEWQYKPVGLVGYGGISAAGRSTNTVKLTLAALKTAPIPEGVWLPNVFTQLKDGVFHANDFNAQGATATLNELFRWTEALKPLREEVRNGVLAK